MTCAAASLPGLASRALEPELMDDPHLDAAAHALALRGLARINAWSGTAAALWRAVRRAAGTGRLRVLDVACGRGDVTVALARRAGPAAEVHGADVSERAVALARRRAAAASVDVRFFALDAVRGPWPEGYDVIVSSLFLHHLADGDLEAVLRGAAAAARRAVVMSDLRRSRAGLALAVLGTRVLSRSPVVHRDGPQSVRAALTRGELERTAAAAGLAGARVDRAWPQRLLLSWSRP